MFANVEEESGLQSSLLRDGLDEGERRELEGRRPTTRRRLFGSGTYTTTNTSEKKWSMSSVVWHEVGWLTLGCVVLLIRMPFSISIPYFQARILAKLKDMDSQEVWLTIKMLAIAGSVDAALDFWCVYLFSYTKSRMMRLLRLKLFEKILGQEVGYFDVTSSGELASRLTTDIATLANDLTWVFRFSIEAVARIIGVSGTLFTTEWRLALVTCTIIPVMAVANRLYSKVLKENAIKVQDSLARANSVAQEVLSCFRVVYSFANERFEYNRYSKEVQENFCLNVKQAVIDGIYYMLVSTFLMNTVVRVVVLGFGTHLFFRGEVNFEQLSRFIFFLDMLQNWCNMLFDSFSNLIKSSGASAHVFGILNRKADYPDNRKQRTSSSGSGSGVRSKNVDTLALLANRGAVGAQISFQNVHFFYPARPEHIVLKGVSFEADSGKTLAIIGKSGAGKSTVIHLIENFYRPAIGRVLLDGQDVHSLSHVRLHRMISIVNQDTVLFSGTIYENITYSLHNNHMNRDDQDNERGVSPENPGLGQEAEAELLLMPRVIEAAQVAHIHHFISSLPKGYHTEVGERGVQLSGGQKQRIAIARAVLLDPAVLLLDEATSSLDNESEAAVKEALETKMEAKTVIIVAHRLSTIMNADHILVMENGEIIDQGSPSSDEMQARLKSRASEMAIVD